jgi:hypothetical protein
VAKTIELNKLVSICVFIKEVNTKQGRAIFIVKFVTNLMGYSILVFSQKYPIIPRKNIGEIIFKTVKIKSINFLKKK